MKRRRRLLIPSILVLIGISTLAAAFLYSNEQVTPPVSADFSAKTDDAQTFDQLLDHAKWQALTHNTFILTFNEEQISSWMSLEGKNYADRHGYSFPFQNIQVGLDDGRMTFYGEASVSDLTLPMQVVIKPGINDNGHLVFDVESAQLGQLGVPEFLLKSVRRQIDELLTKPFRDIGGDFYIVPGSLSIQDDVFSVQGQLREGRVRPTIR